MKKNKQMSIVMLLLLTLFSFNALGQSANCETFNNGIGNWQGLNAQILNHPNILHALDQTSPQGSSGSWISNSTYNAEAIDCQANICYDYKVFHDGYKNETKTIRPSMRIFIGTVDNQTLFATFRSYSSITENSPWYNLCAPIKRANGSLPNNSQGEWIMSQGSTIAQWNFLVENFDGVAFNTDVAYSSNQTEVIGIDNFCLLPVDGLAAFHFEDYKGMPKNVFKCGESVYMDGSASQNESAYYIDVWRRPIGGSNFVWQKSLGWTQGTINTINLTSLFATQNYTFQSGYEYQVKLAIQNLPCISWIETTRIFRVVDADPLDPGFSLNLSGNSNGSASVTATANNNTVFVNHGWQVYLLGSSTPLASSNSINPTFNNLQTNTSYYMKHGVWNNCNEWTERRIRFRVSFFGRQQQPIIEYLDEDITTNKASSENIKLFPNPSKTEATISIVIDETEAKVESLEVLSMTGIAIPHAFTEVDGIHIEFRLSNKVKQGIYFVKITLEDGQVINKQLLVK